MNSKRLIEVEFPLSEVSKESAREKNIRHGHISTLHIYWARRPLAASRTTTLAALLPYNPQQLKKHEYLLQNLARWEAISDPRVAQVLLGEAHRLLREAFPDAPPRVLDPFAGGGSIPLEALRLGCETHALDYNPLAVLLNIAILQYPLQFGETLVEEVRRWGEWVLQEARRALSEFYPTDPDGSVPVGYYWMRTLPCQNPACGVEIPLTANLWLAKKDKKRVALRLIPNREARRIDAEIVGQRGEPLGFDPELGTVARARVSCPMCGGVIDDDTTRRLFREGKAGQRMMAVVLHHPQRSGKFYRLPTERDLEAYNAAQQALKDLRARLHAAWGIDPVPDESLPTGGRSMYDTCRLPLYGLCEWGDLFNARQQLALITFTDAVRRAHAQMLAEGADPELAKAVATYLAFVKNKLATYLCSLTRWRADALSFERAFDRQALPMVWDYGEVNPFSDARGSWDVESVLKVLQSLSNALFSKDVETHPVPKALHGTATRLPYPDNHFDAVVTDPPYYDNVNYSVLSDFFYVWLKRSIGSLYPDLFATPLTPKSEEIVADAVRHDGSERAKAFFEQRLAQAFREIQRVLKPDGIAVIVFAHKTTEAWETVLNALLEAGLYTTASWPLHTEMKARLLAQDSAALASSIYLVCRKRVSDAIGYWSEVRAEVKANITRRLSQFWDAGIRGADFFMSAIGPALEAFGRYARVERASGEPVTAAEILELVQQTVSEYALRRILHEDAHAAELDALSRFYLLYRWSYGRADVPFDEARKLAAGVGLELTQVWGEGRVVQQIKERVHVLAPHERAWGVRPRGAFGRVVNKPIDQLSLLLEASEKPDMAASAWDALLEQAGRSLIDALQLACTLWEHGQTAWLQDLLYGRGYGKRPAFWLLAQAISEILPAGDKEKQLLQGLMAHKRD